MPDCPVRRCCRVVWMLAIALAVTPASGPSMTFGSELRRSAFVQAVENALPSVVNIHGRKTVRGASATFASQDSFRQVNGMGTGTIIDERGYIVTNYHVVQDVNQIKVTLADCPQMSELAGKTLTAELVEFDTTTDLAIIKIDATIPLPTVPIGTSSDLMLGEDVIAIGNAYGYQDSISRGVISSLNRPVQVSEEQSYPNLIQTDASINPGNSGGPLLNIEGKMIGVVVAVRVGAQGIGFAIPIDDVMEMTARLMSTERVGKVSHGLVGKTNTQDEEFQFIVTEVKPGTPAGTSGLQPGDIVESVGGRTVERALDIERALLGHQAGEEVELLVTRKQETLTLRLKLEGREQPAADTLVVAEDRNWQVLGMQLTTLNAQERRQLGSRYRGGLKVTDVRPDGPAARQGIRPGDILVGMHVWETISLDNVAYILSSNQLSSSEPLKFYIVRGGETLYGHMRLASN